MPRLLPVLRASLLSLGLAACPGPARPTTVEPRPAPAASSAAPLASVDSAVVSAPAPVPREPVPAAASVSGEPPARVEPPASGVASAGAVTPSAVNAPDFTGEYAANSFGELHLVQTGTRVRGRWLRTGGGRFGELDGELSGSVLTFVWKEHNAAGKPSEGTGTIGYVAGRAGAPDALEVKLAQANQDRPLLLRAHKVSGPASVPSASPTSTIGGGDWDR